MLIAFIVFIFVYFIGILMFSGNFQFVKEEDKRLLEISSGFISVVLYLIFVFLNYKKPFNPKNYFIWTFPFLFFCLFTGMIIYATIQTANALFDRSEIKPHIVSVVNSYAQTTARGGTRYYVQYYDWEKPGIVRSIHVKKSVYESSDVPRGTINISVGKGFFGLEWVKDCR